jgi:hypothetical protein
VLDRHNADTRLAAGAYSLVVPLADLSPAPTDATGIELSLNGDRRVPERDPTNNIRFTSLTVGKRRRTASGRKARSPAG